MNHTGKEFWAQYRSKFVDNSVESEYHSHAIVPWAVEEVCYFCKYPASHKVAEDKATPYHPMTAYVCCNHFWGDCRNTKVIVKDYGNHQMTVPNQVPSQRPDPTGPVAD